MPSKKVYIVLFVILIVFFLVMFGFFGIENIQQDQYASTLIVGNQTTWTYQNHKWVYLRNHISMEQFNWSKFHVFENNQEVGEYLLWHDDKWYVFDARKSAVSFTGKLLSYQANYEMKVLPFEEEKVKDFTYVKKVLTDHQLSTSSQFSSIYSVSIDFDQDSVVEDFYILSNAFALDFDPDTTFSIAFMVKNDTIYYLYEDISSHAGYNACKPYYHSFVDTDHDGVYEVILACGKYSADEELDLLYTFQENAFKLLISNQ